MGFFFNEAKATAKRQPKANTSRRDIPIASLNQLGCAVCPRDKDKNLQTPKMEPQGEERPLLYILGAAPSLVDDEAGEWGRDKAAKAVLKMLPRDVYDWCRFGGAIQCATDTTVIGTHEMECCRGRVVADIERARPKVVLGIGDAPLKFVTTLNAAPTFRGRAMTARFGNHVCWFFPVNYPNWVFKEGNRYGPSEQEVALRHDLAALLALIDDKDLPTPDHYHQGFDAGIEYITGEGGDRDLKLLERTLADLASIGRTALDIETNGLRPWRLEQPLILTAAVGTFERTLAFSLDLPDTWPTERQRQHARSLFVEYLLFSGIKECHNLAFEMEWLAHEIDPRILRLTHWDDTMSMAHSIDQRPGTKSLEVQTIINYGFNLKDQSPVDVRQPNWWTRYPPKTILRYNGMDTKWTNRLSRTYRPMIAADPKLQYAHDRKVRLASTLVLTEYRGLPVDHEYARTIQAKLEAETKRIEEAIQGCGEVKRYRQKFGHFSPTNTDHVLKLLDKVCGRSEIEKQVKGGGTSLSTDEQVLLSIPTHEVPSAALILEHRGVEKNLSTYVRPITTGRIISVDGMIHAKYSSMTAATHRLAAEDPNAQNWPVRKHREIRGVVRARKRRWLLAADYGQIEFRVAGMASGDANLVKYCWTGYDVHGYWAKRMIEEYGEIIDYIREEFSEELAKQRSKDGKEFDEDKAIRKLLRQESKNGWVFPSIFGAGLPSRAANMHLPMEIAEYLDNEFWDEFPGVKKWQQRLLKFYEKHLYVETLGGLRRHGPMSPNEIINMPIQGTAAEIVTEAMMAVSEQSLIEDALEEYHPIINVHDDLTYEPFDDELEARMVMLAREMCKHRFDFINVPLVVEMKVGERWSELKEVAVYRSDTLFNLTNPYKD